jgi:eukaryotic-like serine/threonine-protein kinase
MTSCTTLAPKADSSGVAIAPGTRIGNYEVAALIGSGGMGEVYRAHDARLGRDVAIKVLPAAFSTDPDRLRRFEQEARAAAALNHPNILTVHEVGAYAPDPASPAAPYVVSELLEGQTVRDVVSGGPLAIRKVVDYATQIASGLAAAHDKGVVHRDLKPENLFVTRDGRIKILDFGLAKLREPEPVAAGVTMAATRNLETGVGVVLGTAGYMSPEQVRAQPVDHRTDIFSFGAVLYEMISGARAFRGDTAADTISAILKSDPPELSSLHGAVPPTLERIVHHCLEKAPELRFQAARDIVFNLEALSASPATSSLIAPAPPKRRSLGAIAATAAVVLLAAAAAVAGWWFTSGSPESPSFRQVTFRHGILGTARFTADGHNIVYTAAWEALPPEVFIVPANETGGRSLELKNASLLAVGQKDAVVALAPARVTPFLTPGTLARGPISGGAPKPEIENVQAADYAPDGSSLAIVRWEAANRDCVLEFPVGKEIYRSGLITDLRFSRDGTHLAFIAHPAAGDDRGQAVILRRDGGTVVTGPMRESHRGLAWSPSGDEIWTTAPLADGVVEALDLSGRRREVLHVPGRTYLRDVRTDGHVLMEQGTVSRGMIVVTNDGATQRDLSWLNYSYVRDISRDGRLLLFEEEGAFGYRTFVRNIDGSPAVGIGSGYAVALSHDNTQALSMRMTGTGTELWLEPVGPGQARRVSPTELFPLNVGQFFSDGKQIVYAARTGDRPPRIYVQALDGSAPRAISEERYAGPLLSADERWIGANGPSGPVLLPAEGGTPTPVRGLQPGETPRRWTGDGRVFVATVGPTNVRIDRLNPWTGERTAFRQMPVPAITGMRISPPFITPDGSVLTYGYSLSSSDLYVVAGVR